MIFELTYFDFQNHQVKMILPKTETAVNLGEGIDLIQSSQLMVLSVRQNLEGKIALVETLTNAHI